MLAAESAWRVLRAEHVRMRSAADAIASLLASPGWHVAGPQMQRLHEQIARLLAFSDTTHRPKGVVLLETLRRSAPALAPFLDELAADQATCDRLLAQAGRLLDAAARGEDGAAEQCRSLLQRHRTLLGAHLDREDSVLQRCTQDALSPEEWARVASAMSAVMRSGAEPAEPPEDD